MFETIKCIELQKGQVIKDVKKAVLGEKFRGLPKVYAQNCADFKKCADVCPTRAIGEDLSIDLGKCIFCGECERVCDKCERVCGQGVIKFTNFHKIGATSRENLIIQGEISPIKSTEKTGASPCSNALTRGLEQGSDSARSLVIKKTFGHSLKLRQISAGGCNACEMELNACSNANFDMGRFGIEFVASPRHADGVVITGPITKNMAYALEETYSAIPEPKIVILAGACAISGGVFQDSEELNREFLQKHKIDLYIPGCPPHPLTIINAILEFLGQ